MSAPDIPPHLIAAPAPDLPPHQRLLEALGRMTPKAATDPPHSRRVFVNRTVRMDQVDVIGFDMDYTLALYNQPRLEALSAACTLRKMVEKHGWPAELLGLPYDGRFGIRGLVVDMKHGNLLKMDRYGYVGCGYHGTQPLSRNERMRLYREQQVRLTPARYSWIDTLFAIPEAVLYAQAIDFLDRDPEFAALSGDARAARYTKLWGDIRTSIDEAHRDDTIKREITTHLADYIIQDRELAPTLHRFRSAGKKLFLLTNSGWAYTNTVMSYLLDGRLPNYQSWRSYFDSVIVDAKKPGFFADNQPLFALDHEGRVTGPVAEPVLAPTVPLLSGQPTLYQGGNVRVLSEVLGLSGDRVLYIGDHIYGDMLRAKRSSVWRTAMVVQELEDELQLHAQVEGSLQQLEALERRRHRIDAELRYQQLLAQHLTELESLAAVPSEASEPAREPIVELLPGLGATSLSELGLADPGTRLEVLGAARRQLRSRIDELHAGLDEAAAEICRLEKEIEHTFNPFWGPLLKEGTENSRLGEQVEDYACLYTSRVSNFLAYSPFQYFRSPRDHLPHERVY